MSDITINMPKDVAHIINILEQNGHEAFAVGGCVRDAIMGRTPHDWDITTSALPEDVKMLFKRTIDTGIQHGTVTVMMNHVGYEVTTYRIDGAYSDGRHPEQVSFTSNLVEDLKRRDFTINAMAYNDRAGIIDEFGGIKDLEDKIIRCVGVAEERFSEDALRMLRAIRFSAQLDCTIEASTATAIEKLGANLTLISRERIQTELDKLITSNHPDRLKLICEYNLGKYIFDGADSLNINNPSIYNNVSQVMELIPADHYMRFAALLMYEASPSHVLKKLKLDNKTIDICKKLVEVSKLSLPSDKPALRRLLVRYGAELFDKYIFTFICALRTMDIYTLRTQSEIDHSHKLFDEIISDGDCISMKDMAVKGSDLIALGITPGKLLGSILDRLFGMVLDTPALNTREKLLSILESTDNLTN